MKNDELKTMMRGALLLSVASFIAKILSAVYRVPFQNLVGNTGFYVYQQVYPIYGIGMTFALSGFPVFFSRLIAASRNEEERKQATRNSMFILSLFALVLFGALYLLAETIAAFMGDIELAPLIRTVSWMFLFMPLLATGRGFFQGVYRMEPTAVSQVAEQLVRVAVILLAAYWYTRQGTNLYQMGAQAMSGAVWGAVATSVILLVYFWRYFRGFGAGVESNEGEPVRQAAKNRYGLKVLTRRYLSEGLTICLLASILVLFQLVDSFTLYKNLVEGGLLAHTAKSVKGIYDRGQPLVQLGMVVGTGFSAGFIPVMTSAHSQGAEGNFARAAKSLIRMTAVFASAACAGLLAILPEVNHMLFGDTQGSDVLAIYILSIASASLMMAYHAILQSRNQYRPSLAALAAGLSVKLLLNVVLIPSVGTIGASLATVLGLAVMAMVLQRQVPGFLAVVWRQHFFLRKLAGGTLLLFGGAFLAKSLLIRFLLTEGSRTQAIIIVMLVVVWGVLLFGGYALKANLFTEEEWQSIPFGKRLLRKRKRSTSAASLAEKEKRNKHE